MCRILNAGNVPTRRNATAGRASPRSPSIGVELPSLPPNNSNVSSVHAGTVPLPCNPTSCRVWGTATALCVEHVSRDTARPLGVRAACRMLIAILRHGSCQPYLGSAFCMSSSCSGSLSAVIRCGSRSPITCRWLLCCSLLIAPSCGWCMRSSPWIPASLASM